MYTFLHLHSSKRKTERNWLLKMRLHHLLKYLHNYVVSLRYFLKLILHTAGNGDVRQFQPVHADAPT